MQTINDADFQRLLAMEVMLPKPPDIQFIKAILDGTKEGIPKSLKLSITQHAWFVEAGRKIWEQRQQLGLS